MTAGDICQAIEELAPEGLAYDWDRVGLNIGSRDQAVTKVLVALSVTREAFQAARRAKAQMIVAHHPLIWKPLNALRTDDPHTRLCLDIAEAGIACYAAHTNLDVVPGGVNTAVAERLGLTATSPLLPVEQSGQVKLVTFVPKHHLEKVHNAVCDAGAGVIGDYTHCSFSAPGVGTFMPGSEARPFTGVKYQVNEEPERRFEVLVTRARLPRVLDAMLKAHPYDEVAYDVVSLENKDKSVGLGLKGQLPRALSPSAFANHVRAALDVSHVRLVTAGPKRVRTVAVIGGSGGSQIPDVPRGIDALVTGDVKYHDAQAARDRGLAVVDAGHAGTEKWVVPVLADYLKTRVKGLRVATYVEAELFEAITR